MDGDFWPSVHRRSCDASLGLYMNLTRVLLTFKVDQVDMFFVIDTWELKCLCLIDAAPLKHAFNFTLRLFAACDQCQRALLAGSTEPVK